MSLRVFGAAALFVVATQAANVNVINNCAFNVMATPSHEGADENPTYIQPGDTFTRPANGEAWCLKLYGQNANGGGYAKAPTQLEWSNPGGSVLYYDLSNIDMGEDTTFLQHGMNLSSSDPTCHSSSSTCRPAICKPQGIGATQPCEDAYNQPFDTRTLGASSQYDVNMHLCTNNAGSGSGSGSSGSASAPPSNSPSNNQPSNNNAPAASSPSAPAAKPQTTFATQPATTPAPAAPSSYSQKGQQQGQQGQQGQGQPQAYALAGNQNGGPVSEVAAQQGNGAKVVTTYVMNTDVVTQVVTARDAEPTIAKRHMHMHHGHHNHA